MVLNSFKSKIFPVPLVESTRHPGMLGLHPSNFTLHLEILTPKQTFQRLRISFAQKSW